MVVQAWRLVVVVASSLLPFLHGVQGWKMIWSYDPHSPGPIRRAHHSAVTVGDTMMVFGGHTNNYELLDDTWQFNFNTSTWTQILQEEPRPGPRAGHSAAVSWEEGMEAEMLVFGGLVLDGSSSSTSSHRRVTTNEMWSLRITNGTNYSWHLLQPTGEAPSERWGSTLVAWERGRRSLLFGGLSVNRHDGHYTSQSDLWDFDHRRGEWRQLMDTRETPLQRRFSHAACLIPGHARDGSGDRLVIYGGEHANERGTTTLGDLWTLHLRTLEWSCMACDNLYERSEHSMITKDGRIFAFGGYSVQNSPYVFGMRNFPIIRYVYNDLLVGDLARDEWYEFMSNDQPSNRFAHQAVVWRDTLVLYGGVMERRAKDMYTLKLDSALDSKLVSATRNLPYFPMAMIIFGTTNLIFTVLALLSVGTVFMLFLVRRQSRYQVYDYDEEYEEPTALGDIVMTRRRRKNEGLPASIIDSMPLVRYQPLATDEPGDEDPVTEACAVCLVDFTEGEELRVLNCHHRYHKECIDPWLHKSRLCPMCKQGAVDDTTLESNHQLLEENMVVVDLLEEQRQYGGLIGGLSEEDILLAERQEAWNDRTRETGFILAVIASV